MMAKKEMTVEDRLRALYTLQLLDSEKDELEVLKGELPVEVSDLEDEIAGLDKRLEKLAEQVGEIEGEISAFKAQIKETESKIQRYNQQLDEVKNNREFAALNKEIELANLNINIWNKEIEKLAMKIDTKKEVQTASEEKIGERKKELDIKREELKKIIANTEKQEKQLIKEGEKARKEIDERYLTTYDKVRKTYRNGLAVATVTRDACGGCFNRIPSQKQIEIALRKKIIACEHCGRILVDEHILTEEVPA